MSHAARSMAACFFCIVPRHIVRTQASREPRMGHLLPIGNVGKGAAGTRVTILQCTKHRRRNRLSARAKACFLFVMAWIFLVRPIWQ
jgi:hypothetical protein